MAAHFLVKETLRAFLLPPGLLVLLVLLGVWQWQRHIGRLLAGLSALSLYLLATPLMANWLMEKIEPAPLPAHFSFKNIDAIVCLGGGKRLGALDLPRGETVSADTLSRLRLTARLQRQSHKPVLVTGGKPDGGTAEAELMRETLAEDFNVPVRWIEANSNDTRDNALMSAALLLPKYRHIVLVTSAYHIPRAQRAFEAAGFTVTPAPASYSHRETFSYLSFLPQNLALRTSCTALRELAGSLWYRWRQ